MRFVTKDNAMPRGCKPEGERALSNAERQARHRARQHDLMLMPKIRYRRPADRRNRAQRWCDAVNELVTLQPEYVAWLASLPESLRATPAGEVLKPSQTPTSTPWSRLIRPAAMDAIDSTRDGNEKRLTLKAPYKARIVRNRTVAALHAMLRPELALARIRAILPRQAARDRLGLLYWTHCRRLRCSPVCCAQYAGPGGEMPPPPCRNCRRPSTTSSGLLLQLQNESVCFERPRRADSVCTTALVRGERQIKPAAHLRLTSRLLRIFMLKRYQLTLGGFSRGLFS